MSRQVDYTNFVITGYRLMVTVQVCDNCGHEHVGAVAPEVYVLSHRALSRTGTYEVRSDKVSTILARYAYYLGGKPESHQHRLPVMPCELKQYRVSVEQCVKCFTQDSWCTGAADACTLLPAEPLTNHAHKGNEVKVPPRAQDKKNTKSKKTQSNVKPQTLSDIWEELN